MSDRGLLIVEDDPDDLDMLVRAAQAQGLGAGLRVARDGALALEALEAAPLPRLITLDLNLPKLSGLEVLAAAKSDPRTCHIPLVVVSSSSSQRDIDQAYELGASSYVVKPHDYAEYDRLMGELLRYWLVLNVPAASGVSSRKHAPPGGARKGERPWPSA